MDADTILMSFNDSILVQFARNDRRGGGSGGGGDSRYLLYDE
jgi:hypothetical protein